MKHSLYFSIIYLLAGISMGLISHYKFWEVEAPQFSGTGAILTLGAGFLLALSLKFFRDYMDDRKHRGKYF